MNINIKGWLKTFSSSNSHWHNPQTSRVQHPHTHTCSVVHCSVSHVPHVLTVHLLQHVCNPRQIPCARESWCVFDVCEMCVCVWQPLQQSHAKVTVHWSGASFSRLVLKLDLSCCAAKLRDMTDFLLDLKIFGGFYAPGTPLQLMFMRFAHVR